MTKNFNCWDGGMSKCNRCTPYSCTYIGIYSANFRAIIFTPDLITAKPKNVWNKPSEGYLVVPCNTCGDCYNINLKFYAVTNEQNLSEFGVVINDNPPLKVVIKNGDNILDIPNIPCNSILRFNIKTSDGSNLVISNSTLKITSVKCKK